MFMGAGMGGIKGNEDLRDIYDRRTGGSLTEQQVRCAPNQMRGWERRLRTPFLSSSPQACGCVAQHVGLVLWEVGRQWPFVAPRSNDLGRVTVDRLDTERYMIHTLTCRPRVRLGFALREGGGGVSACC